MNYNKVIKDLKQRNDKLQEQYRLRDIRCIHLEYENEMLKSDFEAQHELTKKYAEENQELKKQLEEYQLQNIDLRADIMIEKKALPHKEIKDKTFYNLLDMPTYEDLLNQQKEFIEYLENEKDRLARQCSQIYEDSLGKTRLVNEDIFNEVNKNLSKYKEIIGAEKCQK